MRLEFASLLLLGLSGGSLFCSGCSSRPEQQPTRLQIAASIFPLADVARQVAGNDANVETLLPPGTSPHGYQPNPQQAETIARSRLLLVVGLGLDSWALRSAKASGNKNLRILTFSKVVSMKPIHVQPEEPGDDHQEHAGQSANAAGDEKAQHAEHHHDHHLGDPHMWLDPILMKQFVEALTSTLSELDAQHAMSYRKRGENYCKQLDALNEEYEKALGPYKGQSFVSFHSAFTYLAARYGLHQQAVFETTTAGLNPRSFETVIKFMKANHVRVVFAEPQFPEEKLRGLLEETGAKLAKMDPLGNPSVKGYDSYVTMMRSNLKTLVAALSKEKKP